MRLPTTRPWCSHPKTRRQDNPAEGVTMSDTVRVHHDLAGHRFEAMIEGHCAYLAYMDLGKQRLDMYRTFVPDALRGRGIAAALAQHALDYAEREGYQVIPSCSYVERYIERNRTGSGQATPEP